MKFSVTVTLKKDVLDPQGKVVENTLKNMGMNDLKNIRQGKHFEIEVGEARPDSFSFLPSAVASFLAGDFPALLAFAVNFEGLLLGIFDGEAP